jgi:hypothetical protein
MVSTMPSAISPANRIDAGSWPIMVCFTLWGSVMLLAWGTEVMTAMALSKKSIRDDQLDSLFLSKEHWMLAGMCFSLFLSIAVYSRSVFGLPFLVAGLWKLGCPDAAASLVAAHLSHGPHGPVSMGWAVGKFMDGIGQVFHHSATAWFICVLITGTFSPELDPVGLNAITIPLIFEHWVVSRLSVCSCLLLVRTTTLWKKLLHPDSSRVQCVSS